MVPVLEIPRTGEIIKGHVTLGSLRSRQDFMIANAVTGPYTDGKTTDESIALVLSENPSTWCP